jgi:hypothetical protein
LCRRVASAAFLPIVASAGGEGAFVNATLWVVRLGNAAVHALVADSCSRCEQNAENGQTWFPA